MPRGQQQRPICSYYQRGLCHFGSTCAFRHPEGAAPSAPPPDPGLTPCRFFAAGACAYGDTCRFSHDLGTATGADSTGRAASLARALGSSEQPPAQPRADAGQLLGGRHAAAQLQQREQQPAGFSARDEGHAPEGGRTSERGSSPAGISLPDDLELDTALTCLAAGSGEFDYDDAWQEWAEGGGCGEGAAGQDGGCMEGSAGRNMAGGDEAAWCPDESYAWQAAEQGGGDSGRAAPRGGAVPEAVGDAAAAALPLCSAYFSHGECGRGCGCPHVHGNLCVTCGRYAIHPFNVDEAEAHAAECVRRHDRLASRLRSADVECGICLEKVLSQRNAADRRFGLLTCEHAFCLRCIRAWRARGDADLASAVRTCPLCRATTHFVVPSAAWPATPSEKAAVVSGYKDKLGTIDCRHFGRGSGTCPFGTSCFYRHAYADGTEEPKDPLLLRRYMDEEGTLRVVGGVRLSDFLDTSSGRAVLAGGRRSGAAAVAAAAAARR